MIQKTLVSTGLIIGSLVLGFAGQAEAAGLVRSWDATEAFNDSFSKGWGDGHVAWLPDMVNGGTFIRDGHVTFNEYDDGTAHFFGSVVAKGTNKSWDFNVWFEASAMGTGGPKLELQNNAYVNNGGPVDPATWHYYQLDDEKASTFSATEGQYAGKSFSIFDASEGQYLAQVGKGANGKNTKMGMSFWFGYQGMDSAHSDFNVDLKKVPEPATMSLFTLGMIGLGASALKRKQS